MTAALLGMHPCAAALAAESIAFLPLPPNASDRRGVWLLVRPDSTSFEIFYCPWCGVHLAAPPLEGHA